MKLDYVVQGFREKLKYELPGKSGQILMAPSPMDEARFITEKGGKAKKGAVLILFYPHANGCAIPFIKRPIYSGIHSGQVALPGGRWEESDRTLAQTAMRETEEEIGVESGKVGILGRLSDLYIPASNYMVSPFVGFVEKEPQFIPDKREVDRVIHCDFSQLMDKKIKKKKNLRMTDHYSIMAPYYEVENEMVWGATAMIVSELMVIWGRNLRK